MRTTNTPTHPPEANRRRRGHNFYPPQSVKVPALYSTENIPFADKVVRVKYFGPSQDFYVVELDRATGWAFGYVDLHNGLAEWGNIDLTEVEALRWPIGRIGNVTIDAVIERDCWFTPGRFEEVVR